MINITNEDNMELMARYPDKYFDLAIVDPPYGIGEDGAKNHSRDRLAKATRYISKSWDNEIPTKEYFNELKRVSKNQIIWGGNYFGLPASSCWLVWDKDNTGDFADCELAWTSFNTAVRKFTWRWNGMLQQNMKDKETRIHPTQKPVALYSWTIQKYAKEGNKILDTHLGSGSIAIAIDNANKIDKMNLTLTACELDKDYFDAALKRIEQETNWQSLF